MATGGQVKPNRRGVKSRELVLDAAERVMAEHGYDGASVERVVEEIGIPRSSVYHYFGSKDGILLAVMERGAQRFFSELPTRTTRIGSAKQQRLFRKPPASGARMVVVVASLVMCPL